MSSFIKMSGSVLSGSENGSGYSLGVSEFQMLDALVTGSVIAGKLVVVDGNKDISEFRNLQAVQLSASTNIKIGSADLNETDLEKLDDINNGTVAGNKAVVVSADKDASGFRDVTLRNLSASADLQLAGAGNITGPGLSLSIADLEQLDDLTAGTVAASKAVVVSSDKDASGFRNIGAVQLTTSGRVIVDDATEATTTTDGSLQTDGGLSVAKSAVIGDDLDLLSDSAVLNFGADKDVSLTHVDSTGLLLNSTSQLQFGDSGTYIHQSADGVLDLVADAEIEINATLVDINGAIDASSTFKAAGLANLDGGIEIDNGGNKFVVSTAGLVSAAGAISSSVGIAANGTSTLAGAGGFLHIGNGYAGTGMSLGASGLLNMKGALTVDSNASFAGNVVLGDTAASDTITATGRFNSNLEPSADNTYNLGHADRVWDEMHADEIHISSFGTNWTNAGRTVADLGVVTTVDINGGTADNVVIGGAAPAAGTFTALVANGNVDLGDNTSDTITATGRFDSDLVPSSDSARALGTSALQWSAVHADAGHIDAMTVSGLSTLARVSSSAGIAITAKTGPYALSIADGAGEAIAEAWVTHSDRNLKTNIQAMDNNVALNAVMNLQPATYEKVASGKSEIGFIAQDVAQIVPEICALDANGIGRGIDYSRMSTLLAGALKAQQEQIAQLKEIVAKLQK